MPHPLRPEDAHSASSKHFSLQSLARCPTPCDGDRQTHRLEQVNRCNLWRDAPPLATEEKRERLLEIYNVAISGEMPHPLRLLGRAARHRRANRGCNLWREAPPLATTNEDKD